MPEVVLKLGERGRGAFVLLEKEQQVGEMVVGISEKALTVYHTEVDAAWEGQGLAGKMLDAMVNYAREKKLQVVPLCAYVHARFKKHPEKYADIWTA